MECIIEQPGELWKVHVARYQVNSKPLETQKAAHPVHGIKRKRKRRRYETRYISYLRLFHPRGPMATTSRLS